MLKSKVFVYAVLLIGCAAAFAQTGSVQGIVNLVNGNPAVTATVMLDSLVNGQHGHYGTHRTTTADASGAFSFTQVPAGSYDLSAMKMMQGFASSVIQVVDNQSTNDTLTLHGGCGGGGGGGGHHLGDSLTVVTLQGVAIVTPADTVLHHVARYLLDVNGDGTADYRLSFGPFWYDPANGAHRPANGDTITIQGGLFSYGNPPMVIVYQINGQFWRQAGLGHGGCGGGDYFRMGCNSDSVTGIELAGTVRMSDMGGCHGESTRYGINTSGGWMPDYILDFGRPDYNPGNGAVRPSNGDQVSIVGGEVYCSGYMMMPYVVVYEINGQFWRQPGDTTGMGAPAAPNYVEGPRAVGAPLSYLTAKNYPNPFNPTTTIQYSIPASGNAKLAVYDLTGREVAVLVSGFQEAGTYAVAWDGSKMPSGIYFCRLTSGSHAFVNRMLLLK
jgi:hypothetical protein